MDQGSNVIVDQICGNLREVETVRCSHRCTPQGKVVKGAVSFSIPDFSESMACLACRDGPPAWRIDISRCADAETRVK